jgi:hypothetical protein
VFGRLDHRGGDDFLYEESTSWCWDAGLGPRGERLPQVAAKVGPKEFRNRVVDAELDGSAAGEWMDLAEASFRTLPSWFTTIDVPLINQDLAIGEIAEVVLHRHVRICEAASISSLFRVGGHAADDFLHQWRVA